MEKKYLVVVYRNRRSLNDYAEFTNKQKAENWYKYMSIKAEQQKNENKDKEHYMLDVRLYTMVEVWPSM